MRLHYIGNQLQNIENTAPKILKSGFPHFFSYSTSAEDKYDYNQNGAMTIDPDKKVRISYNYLNLPKEVIIDNSSAKAKNYYTYSAAGQKLRVESRWDETLAKTPITGTSPSNDGLTPYKTTDYIGNFIYEDNLLKRILVDGGYIEDGNYYFYVRDHLGNNRIVANREGSVLQSTEYYPFGLEFANGIGKEVQSYKYNGKELDENHNLNLYDYSARYMNPAVPRFTTVDAFAEKYYSISPYVYVANNPLKFIDPTGDTIRVYTETKGYGHSWISTGENDKLTVYTYGGYNQENKKDGILIKLVGEDAKNYIEDKKKETNVSEFQVTDIEDEKINSLANKKLESSTVDFTLKKYNENEESKARKVDKYSLISNNCTTFVSDLLNAGGSKTLQTTTYFHNGQFGGITSFPVMGRFANPTFLQRHLRRSVK